MTAETDLISRQAAIDTLNVGAELLRRVLDDADIVGAERAKYEWGLGLIESYISDMKELPSAQPETHDKHTETHACDLISRQAAITLPVMPKEHREYQTHNLDDAYEQGWNDLQKCIESLPSAQPELDEWCTDCKEYDHERHCCPRWNRVIRQTLKDMKEEQPEPYKTDRKVKEDE